MLSIEAIRLNASTISLTLLFLAGFYLIYRDMRRIEESIKRLDAAIGTTMIPTDMLHANVLQDAGFGAYDDLPEAVVQQYFANSNVEEPFVPEVEEVDADTDQDPIQDPMQDTADTPASACDAPEEVA